MKLIVKENERALLFRNGVYQRMLGPGKVRIHRALGQSVEQVQVVGAVALKTVPPHLLMRDAAFAESVTSITVPDSHIAIHFVDGLMSDVLTAGDHCFWSIHQQHTFQLIDVSEPEVGDIPEEYLKRMSIKHCLKVKVEEWECALLYHRGAFRRVLDSGTYYFWSTITAAMPKTVTVDLRVRQLEIAGQEILTADKVTLRLNFLCNYRVTDPVRLIGELQDYEQQIYAAVQLALRRYVGGYRLDELLEQKSEAADFVLERLREQQEQLFVEFTGAGLKDIILPGEIRDIMNTVLVAEKSAQANVIARREEVASTRSLLNTARLLDENATLRRLKELEYLERICERVGSISVNGGDLLGQLQELISTK